MSEKIMQYEEQKQTNKQKIMKKDKQSLKDL